MGKRLAIFLKVLAGFLFLAGFSLYFFRLPLLDALIEHQLTKLGIPVQSLAVEDASHNRLVLRDLSLGSAEELRADKIYATWTLQDLLKGELKTLEISNSQLSLDLSGENPPLGSLQKLFENTGDSGGNKTPRISLRGAKINLHTMPGNVTINLDGSIESRSRDELIIAVRFEAEAMAGRAKGNLDATLDAAGKLLGTLAVTEGAITLPEVSISKINGNGSFDLLGNQLQEATAEFILSDVSLPGSGNGAFEKVSLNLQLNSHDANIKGGLFEAENKAVISFDATLQDYRQEPEITIDFTAESNTENQLWGFLGLPQPDMGSAALTVNASGKMPAFHSIANWQSWLQHSMLEGKGELTLNELGYAQKVSDLDGTISLAAEFSDGMGKIALAENSKLVASGLNVDWMKTLGVPDELTAGLKQDSQVSISNKGENAVNALFKNGANEIRLSLTTNLALSVGKARANINALTEAIINEQNKIATFKVSDIAVTSSGINYAGSVIDQLDLSGNIRGAIDNWTGELDLVGRAKRFRVDQLNVRQLKTKLPLSLNFNNDAWQFSLRKQGKISFGELTAAESIYIENPTTLRLTNADVELSRKVQGVTFEHQFIIRPDNFTLLANREDESALKFNLRPGKIVLTGGAEDGAGYSGKTVISAAGMTLPQYQMELDKVAATIWIGANKGKLADFKIGQLRHLAEKPYFTPQSFTGSAKLKKNHLSVNARGGIANESNLTASYVIDSGKGNLKFTFNPVIFSPGILQPSVFFPDLEILEEVSGKVSAVGQFGWSKKGVNSGGMLDLQNLSFIQGGASVKGLSAKLELTDLLSLGSPPQQKISIERIDHSVPMKDVEVIYQIEGDDAPRIIIDRAGLSMMGGTLSTESVLIDPASNRTSIILNAADLDLAALFKIIDVEGLAGNGRLDGRIPITFTEAGVSIKNGQLTANRPGILHLQSETISKVLAGRAEDVDLLLQALTEFHYSELTLKLNNSINNDMVATLSMFGNNPNVLEGRPFRLNINLESNIGKLLKALAEGYGLSNKALRRALRLQ